MGGSVSLLCCLIVSGAGADGREGTLAPRLEQGQELVYKGVVTDTIKGVTRENLRMEERICVIRSSPRGLELGILANRKSARPTQAGIESASNGTITLEKIQLDPQGKLISPGAENYVLPLDGLPFLELGLFLETPKGPISRDQSWETRDPGRPTLKWRIVESENVGSTPCLKVVGIQQSEEWTKPRADQQAWRRTDALWLDVRLGVAQKMERMLEFREAASLVIGRKRVYTFVLDSSLRYPGELFKDRAREIELGLNIKALLKDGPANRPGSTKAIDAMLARIAGHLDNQPPSPYREAILDGKRRLEALRNGEIVPVSQKTLTDNAKLTLDSGPQAEDFITKEFGSGRSVALKAILGKPVLLTFYSPRSTSAPEFFKFAQDLQDAYRDKMKVIMLAMSDDADAVVKQQSAYRLTLPIWQGSSLKRPYKIEGTPKFVLLDSRGVIQASLDGWGSEMPATVTDEVRRVLARECAGSTREP